MMNVMLSCVVLVTVVGIAACVTEEDDGEGGPAAQEDAEAGPADAEGDRPVSDAAPLPDATADGCEGLDEQACEAHERCEPKHGGRVGDNEQAVVEYAGCWTSTLPDGSGNGCAAAAACGREPGGGPCYAFPDQCIPDGWTLIEECSAASDCPPSE